MNKGMINESLSSAYIYVGYIAYTNALVLWWRAIIARGKTQLIFCANYPPENIFLIIIKTSRYIIYNTRTGDDSLFRRTNFPTLCSCTHIHNWLLFTTSSTRVIRFSDLFPYPNTPQLYNTWCIVFAGRAWTAFFTHGNLDSISTRFFFPPVRILFAFLTRPSVTLFCSICILYTLFLSTRAHTIGFFFSFHPSSIAF